MSTNTNTVNNTSIPNAATLLEFANLQVAAEALYEMQSTTPNWINNVYKKVDQENKDNDLLQDRFLRYGNGRTSKFTATQAEEFAQKWEIVSHIANTGTGFSGTLFRARKSDVAGKEDLKTGVPKTGIKEGDLVISFRSTEFIDDSAHDNQATNTLEIKNKGWAFGQIADMEKWVQSLKKAEILGNGKEVSVPDTAWAGIWQPHSIYCTIMKGLTSTSNKPLPLTARVSVWTITKKKCPAKNSKTSSQPSPSIAKRQRMWKCRLP